MFSFRTQRPPSTKLAQRSFLRRSKLAQRSFPRRGKILQWFFRFADLRTVRGEKKEKSTNNLPGNQFSFLCTVFVLTMFSSITLLKPRLYDGEGCHSTTSTDSSGIKTVETRENGRKTYLGTNGVTVIESFVKYSIVKTNKENQIIYCKKMEETDCSKQKNGASSFLGWKFASYKINEWGRLASKSSSLCPHL